MQRNDRGEVQRLGWAFLAFIAIEHAVPAVVRTSGFSDPFIDPLALVLFPHALYLLLDKKARPSFEASLLLMVHTFVSLALIGIFLLKLVSPGAASLNGKDFAAFISALIIFASAFALSTFAHHINKLVSEQKDENLCTNCGYDLRASPVQCPECGQPTPKSEPGEHWQG